MIDLRLGDCLEEMKKIEANSVDTVITDPPYGLSFMGQKWDYNIPSIEIWKETLRVLKPGGTALIFAGTRTQHRMAVNVEDAGFELRDVIMWLYGSGFPKATDISKQLDKGHEREVIDRKVLTGNKDNSENFGKDRTGGKGMGLKPGMIDITEPSTPEAKLWNGWKSHGLKPAYEPILVAVKPNEGTYANNALTWGVSGLNIDGGRVEGYMGKDRAEGKPRIDTDKYGKANSLLNPQSPLGRFPANIILDEEAGALLDEQSGVSETHSMGNKKATSTGVFGDRGNVPENATRSDKGGASRFFYCAKSSKRERNAGCEGLEEKQTTGGGGGIGDYKDDVNSMSGKYGSEKAPAKNNHPTIKPLKLMEYLCTLTKTPTGGTVLDPFMGSGTTGLACKNTGRDFIGIELEEEYYKIAEARINYGKTTNSK